jgi:hypothetical protein
MNRTFRRFARQTPSDAKNAFFGPPSRTGWEGKSWGFQGVPGAARSAGSAARQDLPDRVVPGTSDFSTFGSLPDLPKVAPSHLRK